MINAKSIASNGVINAAFREVVSYGLLSGIYLILTGSLGRLTGSFYTSCGSSITFSGNLFNFLGRIVVKIGNMMVYGMNIAMNIDISSRRNIEDGD